MATSRPRSYRPCSARPTKVSAARNNPPARSHPFPSHPSTSPAPPAKACSAPMPACRSAACPQLCCCKSSSGATDHLSPLAGTVPAETETAKYGPENNACKARFPAHAPSHPDQNPPRCAPLAEPLPNISAADPTTPCCTPPASPARKILPTATYQSSAQTVRMPLSRVPAPAGSQYLPKPAAPSVSTQSASDIPA